MGSVVGVGAIVAVNLMVGWCEHPARESARMANRVLILYFFMISCRPALSL